MAEPFDDGYVLEGEGEILLLSHTHVVGNETVYTMSGEPPHPYAAEPALRLVRAMVQHALVVLTRAVGDPRESTAGRVRYVWHELCAGENGKRFVCETDGGMVCVC